MINFVMAKWRGGRPDEQYFVLDIRHAPDVKIVCETATDGLARYLCALLNKDEAWKQAREAGTEKEQA